MASAFWGNRDDKVAEKAGETRPFVVLGKGRCCWSNKRLCLMAMLLLKTIRVCMGMYRGNPDCICGYLRSSSPCANWFSRGIWNNRAPVKGRGTRWGDKLQV